MKIAAVKLAGDAWIKGKKVGNGKLSSGLTSLNKVKTLLCAESVYQVSQTQNRYRQGQPETD